MATIPTSSPQLKPSPLTTLISSDPAISPLTHLVSHNLQHQHSWTSLSPHAPPTPHYPHTLLSGLPPARIYIHPDEQIYMLENKIKEADIEAEREWVVPTWVGEKDWTLKRLAGIFDGLPENKDKSEVKNGTDGVNGPRNVEGEARGGRKVWSGKKLLLAVADTDSTVVYYIVHDGIVKPRQN